MKKKKKLNTRFPAVRIKKIMQADEDVGKIAMAVPILVSKALELFLQDLCDRTYEVTLQRGAKTLNSMHLKQCVQSFTVFEFLRDIVGEVPDHVGFDAAAEDRSATKRRKVADGDCNYRENESKRDKLIKWTSIRYVPGMVRGSQAETEANEAAITNNKHEIKPGINDEHNPKPTLDLLKAAESEQNHIPVEKTEDMLKVRNFDLNLDLDENGDTSSSPSPKAAFEMKPDEYLGLSLMEVGKISVDRSNLLT
ncbi:hypothetical protein SSX86_012246 [Deinandra increscens subsp. villosa]|uniref:Transcription factor CBF/NF-Y/archaeal histone domain-containing protein n=1 Tax=Deinandra increscens subsp. villosa TaxID=3103831 RepID=A0AAP0D8D1_9ASTR